VCLRVPDATGFRPPVDPGVRPREADPVWSKNSCGFAFVVFQESSEPFTTSNRAFMDGVLADRRKEYHVTLALMIPFVMIMRYVFVESAIQGSVANFAQEVMKGQSPLSVWGLRG
jgi:hypothetical protein